ncbi:CD1375 family protein [Lacticaseibacillus daqingensis]
MYADAVRAGERTLDKVPPRIRQDVQTLLESEGEDDTVDSSN